MPATEFPGVVSSSQDSAIPVLTKPRRTLLRPTFEFVAPDLAPESIQSKLASNDAYSLALDYVHGRFEVRGDLVEAVRYAFNQASRTWRGKVVDARVRWTPCAAGPI